MKIPRCAYKPVAVLEYNTVPMLNVPGDAWCMFSRHLAPTAEEVRQRLIQLRSKLQWSRPMMAAFMGTPTDTVRRWEDGTRKPSGAARRLIWLLDLMACHPEKLRSGLDLMFWGRGDELIEFGRQHGVIPSNESD